LFIHKNHEDVKQHPQTIWYYYYWRTTITH